MIKVNARLLVGSFGVIRKLLGKYVETVVEFLNGCLIHLNISHDL